MAETDSSETNGHEKAKPDLMLPKEVGTLIRRSDKTVYRIAQTDPTFPCIRIGGVVKDGQLKGGSLLVPRQRLLKWLAQRTQGR